MVGKTGIGFILQLELLSARFAQYTDSLEGISILRELALDPESLGAGGHVLTIGFGKIAAGKAEVVNGIQQVSLAYTIGAAYADNALAEAEPGLRVVLKIDE